jgi:hypothetical protein
MEDGMKALTIRQPFASLIAIGAKPIEYRTWATRHRGPMVISVSSAWKGADREFAATRKVTRQFRKAGLSPEALPLACIIAVVTLADCVESKKYPGEYEWRLKDIQRLERVVPTPGKLGLWTLSPALESQVLAALKVRGSGRATGRTDRVVTKSRERDE